jgi:N-acetylglucosaminyl-diphospho-decaprenol L-rhamnosyltransferase
LLDLSVIIVSWNVADLLAACLDSLGESAAQYSMEIIVVDSASSDDTVKRVQRDYPHVKMLAQTENLGFSRCNNIGLAAARGRYLLLLNPDTEVHGDALAQMIAYLDANPPVGIVGPHTLNTDGSTQSTRRRFPNVRLAFFESTWLQPLAPKAWLDHFYVTQRPDDAVIEVDWAQGSALMARREVYEQIGGLDTDYIMYYEELDWCKRAKGAGWRVVYLGTAQITHHGGKSTEQVAARKHIHFQESKLRYYRKYHGRLVAAALRMFLFISYGWQVGREGLRWLMGSKRSMREERVRAYLEVLRSGLKVRG